FEVQISSVEPGVPIDRGDYSINAFPTQHGGSSLGYSLVEKVRLGRFNPDRARELGVPEGPLWGSLHRGETVTIGDAIVSPADVVGPPRPGRKVVASGDTRPCRETVEAARAADLLIHEATFGRDEEERARKTGHSTARDAAR